MDQARFSLHVAAVLTLLLAGCGQNSGTADGGGEDFPDWPPVETQAADHETRPDETAAPADWRAGESFRYRRVVLQELTQGPDDGGPVSRSRLELLFTLTVEDVHRGGSRYSVRFDRVQYDRTLGAERVTYDSAQPGDAIPREAAAWQGMVGHGFTAQVDAAGRIVELPDFDRFIRQCLRDLPIERQLWTDAQHSQTTADRVAMFLDESFGLAGLLHSAGPGDERSRTRPLAGTAPAEARTVYRVAESSPGTTVLSVSGEIVPLPRVLPVGGEPVTVEITGGSIDGTCRLEAGTGLPQEVQVRQVLRMRAVTSDGARFDQHKSTLTTLHRLTGDGDGP